MDTEVRSLCWTFAPYPLALYLGPSLRHSSTARHFRPAEVRRKESSVARFLAGLLLVIDSLRADGLQVLAGKETVGEASIVFRVPDILEVLAGPDNRHINDVSAVHQVVLNESI